MGAFIKSYNKFSMHVKVGMLLHHSLQITLLGQRGASNSISWRSQRSKIKQLKSNNKTPYVGASNSLCWRS